MNTLKFFTNLLVQGNNALNQALSYLKFQGLKIKLSNGVKRDKFLICQFQSF